MRFPTTLKTPLSMSPWFAIRILLLSLSIMAGPAALAPYAADSAERCEGTILDEAGNPLAGVDVTFLNLATGNHAPAAKTSKKGKYSHNFLAANREPGWEIRPILEGYMIASVKLRTTSQDGSTAVDYEYVVGSRLTEGRQTLNSVPLPGQARQVPGSKGVCIVNFVMVPADMHGEVSNRIRQEINSRTPGGKVAKEGSEGSGTALPAAVAAPAGPAAKPYDEAVSRYGAGDYAGSIVSGREAIAQSPDNADAHRILGSALLKTEVLPEAETELKKSLELNPEAQGANFDMGMLYIKKGRMMQAVPFMEKEHQLNPDSTAPLQNLAGLLADTQQYDKAIGAYEKLLGLAPDSLEAYARLAEAYKETGNLAKEQETYQKMGEQDSSGMAFYNLGNILFNKSEMSRAADAYVKAIQQAPDNALAHYQLGMVYVNLAKFKEAIGMLEAFAKLRPKDPKAAEAKSLAADLRKMAGG